MTLKSHFTPPDGIRIVPLIFHYGAFNEAWLSRKNMSDIHWDHITLNIIFIPTHLNSYQASMCHNSERYQPI